ncbi:unnamed protein product [Chondrus crispus]|uniref:DUF4460 domain-containing protein n=1 Tax=Chondrus crispus TaxID=2769 RepID=R7QPR3_CHOCR|nr:unnamed protein product [Chondrus crispus]CDF40467.1 unnamed protein product [Chondrus crispus]|eukprot:XP_005710761.1 unnamed protein product [Chondrus crispus]
MLRRVVSTSAREPKDIIRELKRHVHRLYKHIHPDRLGQFPQHRKVNEASFQVLQSAIERHFDRVEARTRNIPPQAFQPPKELTFFAKAKPKSSKGKHEQNVNDYGLHKAVVPFHETNLGHALHSLFESLGLEPPPQNILPGRRPGPLGQEGQRFSSLTELIRHARRVIMSNVQRQQTGNPRTAESDLDDEMLVTRLALQRSRGLYVTLGAGLPPKAKLVVIFRRLARTLSEVRTKYLSNLVVEMDGGFDVTLNTEGAYPWMQLGACASTETWRDSLSSSEVVAACQKSNKHMTRLRELEARVAIKLGIKLVMHNINVLGIENDETKGEAGREDSNHERMERMLRASAALDSYEQLLLSLISSEVESRQVREQVSVALMIDESDGVQCEAEQGVIRVGLSTGADAVLSALSSHGRGVHERFEQVRCERVAEEKRVANVKRAVGINSLRRAESVSTREWGEALAHMRADAGRLRGVLDGVPVVIGTQARVIVESGEVEVPHDFYRTIRV